MPQYLIAIAVGPVQSFIAAARATHDLWFGSYVLSEVSKAVAFELHQQKAELIFPNPENKGDLKPDSELNVANKLLALISKESPEEVKKILEKAKKAACDRWENEAQKVFDKFVKYINQGIWDKQVNDVLELYGAWVKLGDSKEAYKNARERVDQLLSARKSTRDFKPAAKSFDEQPYFGLFKSSLDAARETVLREKEFSDRIRRKLRLSSEKEWLDCPGLVKRLGGSKGEQFPSVVRVALDTWLQQIEEPNVLAELKQYYEDLVDEDWATRVKKRWPQYGKLPFDGSVLFPDRIEALRQKMDKNEDAIALQALEKIETVRKPLYKQYGEPTPYYAILVADGDKMGELLDNQDYPTHQKISLALNHFAQEAREIVENETHHGACVYAGGDDVMALLPIDTAVACADELRNAFEKNLTEIDPQKSPTLSVGLGIVHAFTAFSHALSVARRAEKLAKDGKEGTAKDQQRNALAIIVDVRSGVEIAVRGQWDSGIVERLRQWQKYYKDDQLSSKTAYDLKKAVADMEWAQDQDNPELFKTVVEREINRVLKKKRERTGTQELSTEVAKYIKKELIDNIKDIAPVLNELIVARWLVQKKGA